MGRNFVKNVVINTMENKIKLGIFIALILATINFYKLYINIYMKKETKQTILGAIVVFTFIALVLLVGSLDYKVMMM